MQSQKNSQSKTTNWIVWLTLLSAVIAVVGVIQLQYQQRITQRQATTAITPPTTPNITTPITLYLINFDSSGQPRLVTHNEMAPKSAATAIETITYAMTALLQWYPANNSDLQSFISPQTVLLDTYIADNVVYLNFNENIRFNPFGNEGLIWQIRQIAAVVHQATDTPCMQLLINGNTVDFLAEGLYIAQPIDITNPMRFPEAECIVSSK